MENSLKPRKLVKWFHGYFRKKGPQEPQKLSSLKSLFTILQPTKNGLLFKF